MGLLPIIDGYYREVRGLHLLAFVSVLIPSGFVLQQKTVE